MEGEAKCLPMIPHFIIFPYDPTFYNFFPMIPLFISASISRAEELWLDQNSSQLRLRELLLHDDGNGELVFLHQSHPIRQLLQSYIEEKPRTLGNNVIFC